MWWEYYAGGSGSQADIWSDLSNNGAPNGDGGVSPSLFIDATRFYSGTNTYFAGYDNQTSYNGGRNGAVQAIADIKKSIEASAPPAVIAYGSSWAMVMGYGSSKQCWVFGCQPSFDWVRIHVGVSQAYYLTTVQFANNLGPYIQVFYSDPWGYLSMSNDNWAEFDAAAGTYYGDPNPPTPTWDGGGDDDPPPLEAYAATSGNPATVAKAPKAQESGFVPNPKNRPEIIADFVAGVKRTHLNNEPGLESLTLEDGKLKVSAIVKVRSVSDHPDYYILYLEDRSTHRLYAQGTVNASGFIGGVKLESADTRPFAVVGAVDARAHALTEYGISAQADAEPIFGFGDIGLPEFSPMFLFTDTSGRSIVVTPDGKAFHLVAQGKKLLPKAGEVSLRGKEGDTLVLRELARRR